MVAAEQEALKHAFSYVVNSIDATTLLPFALSKNLISDCQRAACSNETDPYKQAEVFLGFLQQAVNADYTDFHIFVKILKETGQAQAVTRLRDELAHSFRSMQQPSTISSSEKGESVSHHALVEELGNLRVGYAKLLYSYKTQLLNSSEAQEEFIKFLPRLFSRAVEDHCFLSHFNSLVEEEVSLFNTFYLRQACSMFPEDVCATTRQLVDEYELQCRRFMTSATVNQFKQLFPATATSSRLSLGKVTLTLKLEKEWNKNTLDDLIKLVDMLGVSGSHLHLSNVKEIAVIWLCSTTIVKQLKLAILEATCSLKTIGVLQVFIGEEELVLEYSVKAEEGSSTDLSMNCEEQQSKLTPSSLLIPFTESLAHNPVTVHLVRETDIDYQCPICFKLFAPPFAAPFVTSCAHHLCQKCRDHLLHSGEARCPTCRKPKMLNYARHDQYLQRVVNSLKVHVRHLEGLEWVGELKDLHDHLYPTNEQCEIACPFACAKSISIVEMREHTRCCPKRMISCENCGYYNMFTVVTEHHYPVCPQSIISCPNQHCQVERLRRHQLEQHLNECSHQLVDCPSTDCSVQLPRGEMKLHTLELHNQVLDETKQAVAIIPAAVSPQYQYNQAPIEFIISNYREKKEANEAWHSPPFYTQTRGYKIRIKVYLNGKKSARGFYISTYAGLMRGEYDDELEWPFEEDIKIGLLNWRADSNHHSGTISFNKYSDPDHKHIYRVIDQEEAPHGYGKSRFISHIDLVPTADTEYVHGGYLKLRVSAAAYSTHLHHLTPSWQDSFIGTQSGAQFTISEYSKRRQFKNEYYSPPFTTSPQGYTFCLKVYANGYGSGEGSHLSLYVIIMKGQHDDHLQWPFTGSIVFKLLNWLEDKGHYKKTLPIDMDDNLVQVTEGEYGDNAGCPEFISQSTLNSPTNSSQYLYQDCIRVKVQAVKI